MLTMLEPMIFQAKNVNYGYVTYATYNGCVVHFFFKVCTHYKPIEVPIKFLIIYIHVNILNVTIIYIVFDISLLVNQIK